MKSFFINSNICLNQLDVASVGNFYNAVAGNTGNAYITYSLLKELYGGIVDINHIQNIYTYDFANAEQDISFINSTCDNVFLILQDQIRITESYGLRLPYDNLIAFLEKIKKSLIVVGLGANSFDRYDKNLHNKLNPDLIKFLKVVSEKTNIIGLRGYYTQEVLHNLGINNTQVVGCPSYYEMGKNRVLIKKVYSPDFKIALNGSAYLQGFGNHLSKVFLQDRQPREEKLVKAIAFENQFNCFGINNQEILMLKNHQYEIFSNIESWKKSVSEYDFMIGERLHGGILALNSGVCAVVTNSDSRAREMSEFLKIPYLPNYKEMSLREIYEVCDYTGMNKAYPILYRNYEEFLNKNGLKLYNGNEIYEYKKQPDVSLYGQVFERKARYFGLRRTLSFIFSISKEQNKIKLCIFGIKITINKK